MAYNFPSSPAEGAIFADPTSGAQYVFKSGVWMQSSAAQIRLTANPENLLVNGAFQINQEIPADTSIPTGYWADQWQGIAVGAFSPGVQRFLQGTTGRYGMSSQNGVVLASPVASEYFIPAYQPIEGLRLASLKWGYANAIPAVLNFKMTAVRTGVFGCAIKTVDGLQSIGFDIPWTSGVDGIKEFTFPIPARTVGTWNGASAGVGAVIAFSHTLGSSFKAAAHGVWQTTNCNGGPGMTNNSAVAATPFQIFDVQLLADPLGTGIAPPFVPKQYAEDLADCQRYWFKTYNQDVKPGTVSSGGSIRFLAQGASSYLGNEVSLPVPMRTQPTGVVYNPSTGVAGQASIDAGSAACVISPYYNSVHVYLNSVGTAVNIAFGAHAVLSARM